MSHSQASDVASPISNTSLSPPAEDTTQAIPSSAPLGAEQTFISTAASPSPAPLPSSAPDSTFSMNDRDLLANLSAAADRRPSEGNSSAIPSPEPSSSSDANIQAAVTALAPDADTTLHITLGRATQTFLVASPVLAHFTAWPAPEAEEQEHEHESVLHIDLTSFLPPSSSQDNNNNNNEDIAINTPSAHLYTLHLLLRALHHHEHNHNQEAPPSLSDLCRLAALQAGLGLRGPALRWLRRGMGDSAGSLGGVGGWLGSFGGVVLPGDDELRALERAVRVCEVFGWEGEEKRRVLGRLAYVGSVGEVRRELVERVYETAQRALCDWTVRIGRRPCENLGCNTNRIAGLNAFLLASGLYPRGKMVVSLHELVSALQYVTATDAELMTVAIETGEPEGWVDERLEWAARIRTAYGGTCTKCSEKTATSMLFPLEDLLCDISFEVEDWLREYVEHGRE